MFAENNQNKSNKPINQHQNKSNKLVNQHQNQDNAFANNGTEKTEMYVKIYYGSRVASKTKKKQSVRSTKRPDLSEVHGGATILLKHAHDCANNSRAI
eukprot:m.83473 g.83473  ORF g.83473 m.83473 type:complete len:98 (+) comp25635_c0_seq1:144-437(+)